MLEVEEISSYSWNFMIFCESSQSSHSLVEILLIHIIFRYLRRIRPKFGNTMLKRLNSPLQKE
jgi:hypothetical protein